MKVVATVGTTGTFERFTALLSELHRLRPDVELVFQFGRGDAPEVPGAVAFLDREVLLEHMRQADLVVCHGGSGSVRDALSACGNVALVPRRAGGGEGVVDDHQLDLARALAARGMIRIVADVRGVLDALEAGRSPRTIAPSALPAAVVAALRQAMGD